MIRPGSLGSLLVACAFACSLAVSPGSAQDEESDEAPIAEEIETDEPEVSPSSPAGPAPTASQLRRDVHDLLLRRRYDEAIRLALGSVDEVADPIGRADVLRLLGQLFVALPHFGTITGGSFLRGEWKPGWHEDVLARDWKTAVAHLERAREIYAENADAAGAKQRLECDIELIGALTLFSPHDPAWSGPGTPWSSGGDASSGRHPFGLPADAQGRPVFEPVPDAYDAKLPPLAKVKFLFRELSELAAIGVPAEAARGLYLQAMVFRARYGASALQRLETWFADPTPLSQDAYRSELASLADDEALTLVGSGLMKVKLPPEEDVLGLLSRVRTEHPGSPWAVEALYATGLYYQSRGQFDQALAAYDTLEKAHPGNDRRKDVAEHRAAMTRTELWIDATRVQPPGDGLEVSVEYRNVAEATMRVRRVDVAQLILDATTEITTSKVPPTLFHSLADPAYLLTHPSLKGKPVPAISGEPVAEWVATLGQNRRDYQHTRVALPALPHGLYMIEASSSGAQPVVSSNLLWVEDVALIEKDLGDRSLFLAADARTGTPLANAQLEHLVFWNRPAAPGALRKQWSARLDRSVLDANGTATWAPVPVDESLHPHVATYLTRPDGTVALIPSSYWSSYTPFETRWAGKKALVFLECPVVRPGEVVRFVTWLRDRGPGGLVVPAAGSRATVQLVGPAGATLAQGTLPIDAWGAASGELTVPAEATAGRATLVVDGYHGAGNQLEISVPGSVGPRLELKSATTRLPAGGTAAIEVRIVTADGPAPTGWITYRLVRRGAAGEGGAGAPPVVLSGTAATDDSGRLDLRLMMPGDASPPASYSLQVSFIDASGHHVAEDLDLEVTREAFQPSLVPVRSLVDPEQPLELALSTATLDGEPMAATAVVTLKRSMPAAPGSGEPAGVAAEIEPQEIEIATGTKAVASFPAQGPGRYRVTATFTGAAGPAAGATAAAETELWVLGGAGPEYDFGPIELVPERSTAAPGEKLRVMVGTSHPGAAALVAFRPRHGALKEHQVVTLSAAPTVLELALTDADVPNVHLEASLAADGAVRTATREVEVPAPRPPIALTLSEARKAAAEGAVEYGVQAADAAGAPILARLAVTAHEAPSGVDGPGFPLDFFHEEKRGHAVRHRTNLEAVMRSRAERLDPRQLVGRHPALDWAEHWMRQAKPPETLAVTYMGVGALLGDPTPPSPVFAPSPAAGTASEPSSPRASGGLSWYPAIDTDAQGQATVVVRPPAKPGSLRVRAIAMSPDGSLGAASTRLEVEGSWSIELSGAPHALQGDEMEVTARVINGRSEAGEAILEAAPADERLRLIDEPRRTLPVAARGEATVRFRTRAVAPGRTTVRVVMTAGEDRQEVAHGAKILPAAGDRVLTRSTFVSSQGPGTTTLELDLPEGFDPAGSQLRLSLAPTPMHVGIESLQSLLQGAPPGTLGQVGRILPLSQLHQVLSRRSGGGEEGSPFGSMTDITRWLDSAVGTLVRAQDAKGGWGVWDGAPPSFPLTAFACLALQASHDQGIDAEGDSLEKGLQSLEKSIAKDAIDVDRNPEVIQDLALSAYVLARAGRLPPALGKLLFDRKDELPVGALALSALAFGSSGDETGAAKGMIERVLAARRRDDATGKVWFSKEEGPASVEDQAWILAAFCDQGALDPAAVNGVVRWLLEERRGTVWDTPRSTFVATLALFEFSEKFQMPDYQYDLQVSLSATPLHETKVTSAAPSAAHPVIWVPGEHLRPGKQPVVIQRNGQGSLAVAAVVLLTGTEEPEPPGGWAVLKNVRRVEPAAPGAAPDELRPGDVMEVSLVAKAPEAGPAMLLEDPHPAGFTLVDSPPPTGADVTREAHEDRTLFRFAKPGSKSVEVRYRLRADHTGRFRVPAPTFHRADATRAPITGKVASPGILEVRQRP